MIITPEWVRDAVFYQIFPDRFACSKRVPKPSNLEPWEAPPTAFGFKGGDLLGVAEQLDYLKDLGITALYFTPVFTSASNHRYHTYDYWSVDPLLGGTPALRELIDQAHARGIRVVLDGVFNHASRGFYQFNHALENGKASPYLDWFFFNEEWLKSGKPLAAYPTEPGIDYGGPANFSLDTLGYLGWWNLRALPKLNTNTPAVRRFIFDVARHWIEFGSDGWRLDVPIEIDDDSFWQEFRRVVKGANPEAYIVGEIWEDSRRWLQGDQFDAVMNYLFTKLVIAYFIGEDNAMDEAGRPGGYRDVQPIGVEQFSQGIERLLALYDPAVTQVQLNLLDSHDTPRFLTIARSDESVLRLAALFMFTYPGAPCIYYGDEIGLEGNQDPDCRRTFPWDESRWNHDLRAYFQQLISLRMAHPVLRRGSYTTLYASHDVYAFARQLADETAVVVLNNGRSSKRVSLPMENLLVDGAVLKDAWSTDTYIASAGRLAEMHLPPRSGLVLFNQTPG